MILGLLPKNWWFKSSVERSISAYLFFSCITAHRAMQEQTLQTECQNIHKTNCGGSGKGWDRHRGAGQPDSATGGRRSLLRWWLSEKSAKYFSTRRWYTLATAVLCDWLFNWQRCQQPRRRDALWCTGILWRNYEQHSHFYFLQLCGNLMFKHHRWQRKALKCEVNKDIRLIGWYKSIVWHCRVQL